MSTMEICSKKKPHFVSEERILRQYECGELVTCHVLFPLGIDTANLQVKAPNIYDLCHVLN